MTRKSKIVNFRLEEDYIKMIDELEENEKKKANQENRNPLNRTQLVKRAIRNEYATSVDNRSKNAFFELLDSTVEAQLNKQIKVIDGVLAADVNELRKELVMNQLQIISLLKFFMNASNINMIENPKKWIEMENNYDEIITEQIRIMLG